MASVAAIVVSLPERLELLKEALDSVAAQTVQPEAVVIGIDPRSVGEAENCNRLARAAGSEWLAFLHDDDLWRPQHLERLLDHAESADVVVASFDLAGRPEHTIEPHHCDYTDLWHTNWFPPSAVMVRAAFFNDVGGFREPGPGERWVDWTTWKDWLKAGARFACSHQRTMIYRFGPWNYGRSWSPHG